MNSIDIYRNSSIITMRKVPSKIYSWVLILVISSILFLVISLSFKYKKYLIYDACVKNNYIELYVDSKFFSRLSMNEVIIEDNKYQYKVIAIETYSYNMGEADYWKIVVDVAIPDEWMIENNKLKLFFLEEETTLAESMINQIKKGLER